MSITPGEFMETNALVGVLKDLADSLRGIFGENLDCAKKRLPFIPPEVGLVNGLLEPFGARMVFKSSARDVADGTEQATDPRLEVTAGPPPTKFSEGDRASAFVAYVKAMVALCEMAMEMGEPKEGVVSCYVRVPGSEFWDAKHCCFFGIPPTTLEEREAIAAALNFDAMAFYRGKMFIFLPHGMEGEVSQEQTLFTVNHIGASEGEPNLGEGILFFTRRPKKWGEAFLRSLKKPPCWFVDWPMVHQPLAVGHRYLIG